MAKIVIEIIDKIGGGVGVKVSPSMQEIYLLEQKGQLTAAHGVVQLAMAIIVKSEKEGRRIKRPGVPLIGRG
jgi:hypothetical protein